MKKKKSLLSLIIVTTWLLAMFWAFWWFQLRWLNSMDDFMSDALFSTDTMFTVSPVENGTIALYHFFDPECPCTKFNTTHAQDVMRSYREKSQKIDFVVVVPNSIGIKIAKQNFPSASIEVASGSFRPPASPAALIFSSNAEAEYIGPWSPGAVCSTRSEDYVSQVLDELLAKKEFNQTNNLARGCLCPWPDQVHS